MTISKTARRHRGIIALAGTGLCAPMLNLLRGKTVVDRVEPSTGRVIGTTAMEGAIRKAYGGRFVGRHTTMDADPMAFQFRMGNGVAGSVNRFHPATIVPQPIDPTNPPSIGLAVVVDATSNKVRGILSGDQGLTDIWGILVRPWPVQQGNSASPNFVGAVGFGGIQPVSQQFGVWDVLRSGYILVPVVGSPVLGGLVYVWTAAASGSHVQGGFEAATPGGSGFQITGNDKTNWNSGVDAFGVAEVAFNI
jgi:hypothetical protein